MRYELVELDADGSEGSLVMTGTLTRAQEARDYAMQEAEDAGDWINLRIQPAS